MNQFLKRRFPLLQQLLALAVPIAITGGVQTSYHLINAFWVGRLGSDAVAVVSICFPVILLMIAIGSGLSMAGTILIAQNHGAGKRDQVNHVAAQTLALVLLLGTLLAGVGYLIAPLVVRALGAEQSIFADALTYMRIAFIAAPFLFLSATYQAILRGIGEAAAPLRVVIASVGFNAILDPVLIFGWGPVPPLGVEGAAWATLLTQLVTAAAGVWLMLRPRFGFTLSPSDFLPNRATLKRLVGLGSPTAVEQAMQAFTVSFMTVLASGFGNLVLASYGIVFRIQTFVIIPAFSIGMATSILVGQAMGAGDPRQARRTALTASAINIALMGSLTAGLVLAARPIVTLFVPNDPALIDYGAPALGILALAYPFMGLQMAMTGTFRGAGKTLPAMLLTLLGIWGIQLPLAFSLSRLTPLEDMGLWWAMPLGAALNAGIGGLYFISGRWQPQSVETRDEPKPSGR